MPVIIEFSRCIGTYSSAKFELLILSIKNYYFIPYDESMHASYNLLVNTECVALLIHESSPSMVIEMQSLIKELS